MTNKSIRVVPRDMGQRGSLRAAWTQSTNDDRMGHSSELGSSEKPRVCIVVPCHNEATALPHLYSALSSVFDASSEVSWGICFVDDGSKDGTAEALEAIVGADRRASAVMFTRNFGHESAILAGLRESQRTKEWDAVIVMDADLQHPPALIPEILEAWQRGFDVVLPVRKRSDGASWTKQIGTSAFYRMFNLLSDTRIEPGVSNFCLLSREAVLGLCSLNEHHRFGRGLIAWMGFPTTHIPYDAPERVSGETKYDLRKMTSLAFDAVLGFSTKPLQIVTRMGFVTVFSGVAYLVYTLLRVVLFRDAVPGWASMVSVTLILGGVQLVSLGVLGAFVARIFDEVKMRAPYIVSRRLEPSRKPHKGSIPPVTP